MNLPHRLTSFLWACFVASSALASPGDGVPDEPGSVIDRNDLEDIEEFNGTPYYEMARAVARVENFSRDGFCTGVRVGADLFLTNYHCWESAGCRVRFRMGFERRMPDVEQALFECVTVVEKAAELDFAIFRVLPFYSRQTEYPVATLSTKPLEIGQKLVAPGHPVLQPKQIDVSDACAVTRSIPYVHEGVLSMQHQCDTQGGSSGSPLMDRTTGHVVALHWGSAGTTGANHGVPMTLILERIKADVPDVYSELTVAED